MQRRSELTQIPAQRSLLYRYPCDGGQINLGIVSPLTPHEGGRLAREVEEEGFPDGDEINGGLEIVAPFPLSLAGDQSKRLSDGISSRNDPCIGGQPEQGLEPELLPLDAVPEKTTHPHLPPLTTSRLNAPELLQSSLNRTHENALRWH
ncbi:hypothetical protein PG988_006600 [Apiospora saccharicola]